MCMLCVIPPNVIPSREKLENSALNNPHGFGFAIVIPSENRIHAERTMSADESINKFLEMRKRHPEGYAMWHARYATHGSQSVDNCHPFRVNKDRKTYLAHNGILPVLEDDSDRSDTRIFAEDVIPAMGGISALDNDQVWNILEDFTTGSKVCILTVDPIAKNQMYLLHEEKGTVDESGVWWSNDSCYLDYGFASKSKYKYKDAGLSLATTYVEKDSKDWLECDVCESYISKAEAKMHGYSEDFCEACGSCYGCAAYVTDCLCYNKQDAGKAFSYQGVEGWKGWDW
jgi:predicted glutamine amidotransferase